MNFASTVSVEEIENNDRFNAVSLYVPLSLAEDNIVGFDPAWVTEDVPAVMACTVDNYAKIMKGAMLSQWTAAFRQDTNTALVVYVIVFLDGSGTEDKWAIADSDISFEPLTKAFKELFIISHVKMLFDETCQGVADIVQAVPGTAASLTIQIVNSSDSTKSFAAGEYTFTADGKTWAFSRDGTVSMTTNASVAVVALATTAGTTAVSPGALSVASFSPALPSGYTASVTAVTQGTDPVSESARSLYFDYSLALALLCKSNVQQSQFWSLVRLELSNSGFPAVAGVADPNPCWIRSKTAAEEKEFAEGGLAVAASAGVPSPRTQHYWGFLWHLGCLDNTWVVVHSEPLNLLTEALGAWFERTNSSGQYIGNKLSLLRLTGANIKPFGHPSLLSSDINVNDADGHAILNAKNVGYLKTISDSSAQQCVLSSALSLGGTPMTAMLISAYVNYEAANQCADMIAENGTLTDPTLTDEAAYKRIQMIVFRLLSLFSATNGRLTAIQMLFPSFDEAKVGRTELEAAHAWAAMYKDDLTKVTVTGGITAA
jgi:hypothetical protein